MKPSTSALHASPPPLARRTRRLLRQLTPEDHDGLHRLAATRLAAARRGYSTGRRADLSGDDLVQQAFASVLLGTTTLAEGRHPQPGDVASLANFRRWLGSCINSLLCNAHREGAARFPHLDVASLSMATDAPPVAEQVDLRLRKAELMARLREQFIGRPGPLAVIAAWEEQFEHACHIPGDQGHHVHAVRQAARGLFAESPPNFH